ncbi:Vault protein inter-alpha-trypsin [Caulobacter sp. AP07]|uniref:VIT domain-containing protein n=1 Tax=Caulobacter sp. AP07 TaxID=1144304 RepID=UPI0002721AEC|nr:VIT domain-containing protein [Caulobacter sp. AP07]EJL34868.1 Vault protein inter-alpha-trypsin [Caulobacter sp. AP07]
MKVVLLGVALALLSGGASWAAEAANPVLIARPRGVVTVGAEQGRALRIARLDVKTTLSGGLAQTVIEARFDNPTKDAMEGDFTLALPAGAVINGYALDVGGRMVDGVLTGKRQARLVYENRVRAGVDPGLAEVTADNSFHTQIYPILPGQGRAIRLSYVSPLAADGSFVLPLASEAAVGEFRMAVTVLGAVAPPSVTAPSDLKLVWAQDAGGLTASIATKEIALSGGLGVGPWRAVAPLELSRHANGERFFDLRLPFDAQAATVRRLRLYWDRSRSRSDDDLKTEIAVLRRYVEAARPQAVELVTFADDSPRAVVLSAPTGEAVEAALKAVTYGGASSLKGLFAAGNGQADTCILVSDGRMTVDSWIAQPPPCRTLTLSSAKDADRNFLSVLAERGGGRHVDLSALDPEAALARLTSAGPPLFTLAADDGQAVEHRLVAGPSGRWWIIGKTPAARALVFAGPDGARRTLALDGPVRAFDGVGALWGRDAVAGLLATDRPDGDEALALARRYNIATEEASFVVLENAHDYVEAGVAPPSSAGEAMGDDYRRAVIARKAEEAEDRAERLGRIVEAWTAQKAWWAQVRQPKKAVKPGRGGPAAFAIPAPAPPPPPAPLAMAPSEDRERTAPPANAPAPEMGYVGGGEGLEEVVVTAERTRSGHSQAVPVAPAVIGAAPEDDGRIAVEAAAWNPDRPYLKALATTSGEAWRARYVELEKTYGDAPAFYFDVAEWLFRSGRKAEAAQVVVSALDVPGANGKTMIIVADRLQAYGALDRAVWLRERVLFLEPDRPQPRRDLALALVARGDGETGEAREADYRRALDLLNMIVTRPWSGDYDGIELIALMEANNLVARMKAVGLGQEVLDPRLVALLDVDIRAVLEWNTDKTDMDLWVDEPTGEQAIYSNPATAIGGRLSNDMTRGFGPEEYLLRRAPNGEYVLRVNVYAGDVLDPNGPSTVRVRLFRDWGRRNEKQETFTIELKKGDDGAMKVGRFAIGRSQ